jgi:hypothetical protein
VTLHNKIRETFIPVSAVREWRNEGQGWRLCLTPQAEKLFGQAFRKDKNKPLEKEGVKNDADQHDKM